MLGAYGFTFLGPFGILMKAVNLISSYAGVVFIACLIFTKLVREKNMEKVVDTEEE